MPPKKKEVRRGGPKKSASRKLVQKAEEGQRSAGAFRKKGKRASARATRAFPARPSTLGTNHRALLESEQKYKEFADSLPQIVFETDGRGNLAFVNRSALERYGYSKEDFGKGMSVVDLIVPEDRDRVREGIKRRLRGEELSSEEYTALRKDGGTFPVVAHSRPIVRESKVVGLRGIVVDITERKRAEEKLAEANKLFETLLDHTHMMVAYLDPEFNFVKVNRAYAEADGRVPSFFPGKNHFSLYPNEENEGIFHRVVESGEPYFAFAKPFEYAEHPERGVSYWDWSLIPIKDSAGAVNGLVLTLVNVTERKQAEQALSQSEERLRRFMESATDSFTLWDKNLNVVETNEAGLKTYAAGTKKADVIGKNMLELVPGLKESGRYDQYLKVVQTGKPFHADDVVIDPRFGRRRVAVRAFKVGDGLGMVVTDITERKLTEEALKKAHHQLEIRVQERTQELSAAITELHEEIAERRRAEEKLRESEENYKTLVETSNDMIFRVDLKGNFLFTNQAFGKLLGYSAQEIKRINGFELIHPEDSGTVKAQFARLIEGHSVDNMEYRYRTKEGSYLSILNSASPIFDANGNVVAALGAARDITARKEAEEALQKSEEQLRLITDALPVLISYVDSRQHYRFNNKAYEEWFGYSRAEVCGKHIKEVLGGPAYESIKKYVETALSGHEVTFESVVPYKDAGARHVSAAYIPHFGEKGEVKGFFTLVSDITERKRTEKALQESELWMRNMFNSLEEAVFVLTPDRTLMNINQAAQKMFGYTKSELADLSTEVLHVDHQHYVDFGRRIREAFDKGETASFEFEAKRKNGEVFPTEHTVSFLKNDMGESLGIVSVVRDISQRKRAEEELKKYREHLEELVDERAAELKRANERLIQEIAERKQVEEGLEWQLAVNTEVARLSGALITPSISTEDVANVVLDSAQNLTQSEHGFVSSIDPKSLDSVAHTLTKMMGKQCLVRGERRRIRFPIGADGLYSSLWGHALNTRKPFFTNAPSLHQAARGIPTGHIAIKNFLSVPAVIGEELVGQIALANAPRDYTIRDLDAIKRLAELYAMAIQRKRGIEAVQESEEKFRNLAEQSPNMIFINKGGRVIYANRKCEEIMGYTREEFYSPDFDFFTLISEQSRELIESSFSRHSSGEEVLPYEYVLVTKEGKEIDAILTTKLIRYEGENAILGTVTDITERKRTEQELQKRTRDLDERVKELDCLYGIASLVQKPGSSLEEILEGTLRLIPPAWRYPEITCARLVLEDKVFTTKNFRETSWKQASDIIVRGQPVGTVEVYYLEEKPQRDEGPFLTEERSLIDAIAERLARIAERKKGEHQIQELNRSLKHRAAELAAANRELEAFSYSVSHDLRAPLRALEGFSRALAEDYSDSLDEEGKDYLRRIRAASGHMKQLIGDLLNLSLAMRKEMRREETNLSEIAHAITAEFQKTESARRAEFVIQEGVLAHGDPQLLRDVLENLLGNAWKFTEKHSRAKIEFGVTEKQGQSVYFVRDDGAGFDKTQVNKLFVPFQRLHSSAEFSGSGIGLAVVSRIITRHGGRIWAEGEVEKGATFYFTL